MDLIGGNNEAEETGSEQKESSNTGIVFGAGLAVGAAALWLIGKGIVFVKNRKEAKKMAKAEMDQPEEDDFDLDVNEE